MDLSRLSWKSILSIATAAMLLQQAFSYVCTVAMPILASSIANEFGISPAWLGLYLFIQNVVSIFAAIGCGSFILRFGPIRVSQLALVFMGGSLFVVATGQLWLYPLAAVFLGVTAVSTPASSHILAHVCPPKLAPLIFSIKQTGVPVGSLIGGLLIPFFLGLAIYVAPLETTYLLGPFGAAFAIGLIVYFVACMLQPIRRHFDADRQPDIKISFSDLRATIDIVLRDDGLRKIAFAAFAFGGLQSLFAGFFVLYLIDGLNYDEVGAGSIFAISSFTAIWARILWGWIGGRFLAPRWVLAIIGLIGGLAAISISSLDTSSSMTHILAVAILYNLTALSWHGVLLAETARLAPEGLVGGVTGGVLAFTSCGMLLYPAIYGGLLAYTGSYKTGFVLAAVPSFVAFLIFALQSRNEGWFSSIRKRFRS